MYEGEWRVIDQAVGSANVPFPDDRLTGIILGHHMTESARVEVLELAKHGGIRATVYEALPSESEFRMRLQRRMP